MPAPRGRDFEQTRQRLTHWLRARLPGASSLELSALSGPAATGFSNDTLLFDLRWREAGREHALPLVCRIEPTGFGIFPRYDVAVQYRVMQAIAASPVPVPRMHWLEPDPAVLGAPFFVMERVEGRIPSDNPPYHMAGWMTEASPAERAAIWWSGVDTLAAIHRLEPAKAGIDFLEAPPAGGDTIAWQLAHWHSYQAWMAGSGAWPTLEAGWDWLAKHRPPPDPRAGLCWGDARIGNMIFRDRRVVAVLDWEMATLGPAEMDLGWFLLIDRHHSEGVGAARLAGLPGRAETIERWQHGVGREARDLAFWEVFAAWRFAAILARVGQQMIAYEILPPDATFPADNTASRLLARMLAVPAPGAG